MTKITPAEGAEPKRTTEIQRAELLNAVSALPKLHYDVHAMVRRILMELEEAKAQVKRLQEKLEIAEESLFWFRKAKRDNEYRAGYAQ